MRSDRFSCINQLFQQRMAKKHQLSLFPQRAQADKQALPVARLQRLPERRRRQQEGGVLVKHRQRVAHRAAQRGHAGGGNFGGLKLVEPLLDFGKAHPAQAVEEIVQVVAGGHACMLKDELLVSHAGRQVRLRHEADGRAAVGVERLRHGGDGLHLPLHSLAMATPAGEPGMLPVDTRQGLCARRRLCTPCGLGDRHRAHSASSFHGRLSPERSGLSSASPKAKLTGGVQLSLTSVTVPALRGRP